MPPNGAEVEYRSSEELKKPENEAAKEESNKIWYKKYTLRWDVVVLHTVLYTTTAYTLLTFPYIERYKSFLWAFFLFNFTIFGIGAGVHRLWTHRSYKAKWPLQVLLATCYVANAQTTIRNWVKIHRVHHIYTDTDDDPHNARKGLFYSHIGWILTRRPKNIIEKYKIVDMTDVDSNRVVMFFERYHWILAAFFTMLSIAIPMYCWNEEFYYALTSQIARYTITLNCMLSVNSLAHAFGDQPFNKYILPRDTGLVTHLTLGEGWHNYHHTFPYDYRTPEFIGLRIDINAKLIEFFEKIGWAYDLRKPKEDLVRKVIKNKGDYLLQSLVN